MSDCSCSRPIRPVGDVDPNFCGRCAGFSCVYADGGSSRCPSWRCDCFIETRPDDPMGLYPEAFIVGSGQEGAS